MKKIVLSAIVSLGLSGAAIAGGDIAPVSPAPADSWGGFYVGLQAGGVWGDADVNIPAYPSSFSVDVDGFAGGAYVGYNWLLENNLLLGIEADGNFLSGDGDELSGGGFNEHYYIEQKWNASIRGRMGVVVDDTWMPYVTGGYAWTKLETHYEWNGGSTGTKSDTVGGWTAGVGIEYKINTNVHAKLEYRYTNYDTAHFTHNGPSSVDYTSNQVYLGISYRF